MFEKIKILSQHDRFVISFVIVAIILTILSPFITAWAVYTVFLK